MLWEALGSGVVGLVAALVALRVFADRMPAVRLAFATGPVGGLLGGLLTRFVVVGHDPAAPLVGALLVAAAGLSLLVRESAPRQGPRPA